MKKACPKCAIDVGGASVKLRHHLEKAEPLFRDLLDKIEASKPAMKEAGMPQMEYGPALALIHEAWAGYGKVMAAHLHLAQALGRIDMETPTDAQINEAVGILNWR